MPDVSTEHDSLETHRVVTTDDGETHRFRITGDEGDRDGYEYEGDDPPETAVEALEGWIQNHHGEAEQGE